MGSRGASAGTSSTGRGSGRSGAIASAKSAASSAVDAFLAGAGGMASDGEINGAYETAFIAEAKSKGVDNATINNELNSALRTDGINYMKAWGRVGDSKVMTSVPKGWREIEGATTAPEGFKWITNGKSMFGGEREQALVPASKLKG